ncbi:MAG: BrnT family toxin [Bryobacteraceae bacterium]|nr:BrnT family toxin [Bryobacteraceae bacterium]
MYRIPVPGQAAHKRFAPRFAKAVEGDPQVCTYAWVYRILFHASCAKFSQAYARQVIALACRTRPSKLSASQRSDLYILSATIAGVVISGFDWDDANITHIERHQFTPDEVEEVFAGRHKVRRARQKLYVALGETLDGRLAFVVFRRLSGGLIRIVTARDMDETERRLFRRK